MDLDLLEDQRIASQLKSELFKQKAKEAHNRKVSRRPLNIGDWVLRNIKGTARHRKENKLMPKWEGPYLKEEVQPRTYGLMNKEGTLLPNPWHSNH